MKISTFIIDDDPFVRMELTEELETNYNEIIEISGVFGSAIEAFEELKKQPPQLVFLDIKMPQMNGFDLLDKLVDITFEVIFITSFNQYAIQAIRYSALDYLLKPIDKAELEKSIERFSTINDKALMRTRLENLRHNLEVKNEKELHLVIGTKQGVHHLAVDDVVRCEADSNYTLVYLATNKKILASRTLSDVYSMLNPQKFIRIHKTHVVNLMYVDRMTKEGELIMKDGTAIMVSRRRFTEVKAILFSRKS